MLSFGFVLFFADTLALYFCLLCFFYLGIAFFLSETGRFNIKGRFKRLVAPYFLWNSLFLLIYLMLGMFSSKVNHNLIELNCNSFNGCLQRLFSINDSCVDGPMWYVRCVFVLYLLQPILKVLYKKITFRWLAIICVLATLMSESWCSRYYPMYGIASFVLGGYLAYHKIDMFGAFRDKRYLLWPIAIIGLFGGFLFNVFNDTFSEPSGICKLMMLPLFYLLYDRISFIMKSSFFNNYFMPASFTIYAVHIFFTSIFMHILGSFIPKIVGGMFIISIFTIIFSLISSIILWRVANAIFPKVFRIFDGRW